MSEAPGDNIDEVGYGRPPKSTRFQKGRSGNPRGRPRNRRREIPYDAVLGQMVTVREDGKVRRLTAAEAFILQLTKKGLAGDSASARASLLAIEQARAVRSGSDGDTVQLVVQFRTFGVCVAIEDLGLGILLNGTDKDRVRIKLKPWIVEAALRRLGSQRLTIEEQRTVVEAVHQPHKVHWPVWWSVEV